MKLKNSKTIIILTSLILSLFQFAHAGTPAKQVASDTAIQNAILININQYRQKHGLSQLKMDDQMVKEAKNHSIDMANHTMPFGHKYFQSRIDRLHSQIKNSNAGAENVAYNYKDAQDVVNNWVRSPGHRRNIEGNYNLTGIGIARDTKGKMYFTQIFLRTGGSVNTTRRPYSYTSSRPFFSIFKKSA